MDDRLAHIDWTKSKAELAVDLQIETTDDYVGYYSWSKLLGEPGEDPPYWMWAWGMSRAEAIDELVCSIIDKFAPDEVPA